MVEERRRKLAQRLVEEGQLVVRELASEFGVTTETIRKDIAHLERMGIAKKSRGGASYINDRREIPYHETSTLHTREKSAIARRATSLINGRVIMLDGGSTNLAIAKLLSLQDGLTVITNSVSIIPVLGNAHGIELILSGGTIRAISQDMVGFWASRALQEVTADVCFIGANSLSHEGGPATSTMDEVEIKRAMLHSARHKYVVADSSKLQVISTFRYVKWNEVDGLITDNGIDPEFVRSVSGLTRVYQADLDEK